MFYYIEGMVAHVEQGLAAIDANGVAYACHTSLVTAASLKKGERARLYTHLHIREDIFDIYGFFSLEELNCFKMLIGISGVGPKAAVSILSSCTPEKLALAVITDDEKELTKASGVGKKMAQRILLELKDKMSKEQLSQVSVASGIELPSEEGKGKTGEALSALMVLGYTHSEALAAMKGLDIASLGVEEIIRKALMSAAKNI